jgi:hypothetical protein
VQANFTPNIPQRNENIVPATSPSKSFYLVVDEVIALSGRGTVVTGQLIGDRLQRGDAAYLIKGNGETHSTVVMAIGMPSAETFGQRSNDTAEIGEMVGLLLRGIFQKEVSKGDVISATEKLPENVTVSANTQSVPAAKRTDGEIEALVEPMSVKELIVFLKELKAKEEFDYCWILLLAKLRENNYSKFEAADVITAFADDRIGSQSKVDIAGAMIMSSGNAEGHLPVLMAAGQQYCIRTFGKA